MIDFEKIYKSALIVSLIAGVTSALIYSFTYLNNSRSVVMVSGFATQETPNQIAEFNINFTSEDKEKSKAESINNEKVNKYLEAIKTFGIQEIDIKTENINSYQITQANNFDPSGIAQKRIGNWIFNQSISVKLKDIKKINEFVNLTNQNQATNVNGPNLTVDTQSINQDSLYQKAFEDARKKAETLAVSSGRKLGKAISISEGSGQPIYGPMARLGVSMGAAGADVPTGSSTLSKTISVTFEIY